MKKIEELRAKQKEEEIKKKEELDAKQKEVEENKRKMLEEKKREDYEKQKAREQRLHTNQQASAVAAAAATTALSASNTNTNQQNNLNSNQKYTTVKQVQMNSANYNTLIKPNLQTNIKLENTHNSTYEVLSTFKSHTPAHAKVIFIF